MQPRGRSDSNQDLEMKRRVRARMLGNMAEGKRSIPKPAEAEVTSG